MKYVLHKVNRLGMGNRLLSLTTAIAICRSTGAKLIVDWKNSGVVQPDFWDLFRLAGCEDVLAEVQDASAVNGLSSAQTGWECRYDQCFDGVYSKVNRNGDYAFLDIQEIPPISGLRTFFKGEKQGDVLVLAGYTAQGLEPTLLLRHLRFAPRVFERLRTDLEALLDWCAVASCSKIYYQPRSTFSHIILYFSQAKPWKVAPHCRATPKQWGAGFKHASLKWAARPGLIPELSGAEAGS